MSIMGKKLENGLGLKEVKNNVVYGNYNGYEVTILEAGGGGVAVYLNFYGNQELKTYVASLFFTTGNRQMVQVSPSPYGMEAFVSGMTFNSIIKKIKEKLDVVTAYLKENNALGVGYCMSTGVASDNLKTINYNGVYVTVDQVIVERLEGIAKEEEKQFDEKPNNYLKGTLGAILGALVGAATMVALYFMGFFSALSAVVAVYLGNLFYVKFGGKPNNIKNLIVGGISLVIMILACFLLYIIVVDSTITAGTSQSALEYIMSNPDWKKAFTSDMIMNALFTVIGVVSQVFVNKRKDNNDKMNISY